MAQKKYHGRGFTDNIEESRVQRVSFKRYLRELEEVDVDADIFLEEDNELPEDESAIEHVVSAFTDDVVDADMKNDARDMDTTEDGVELLIDEFRKWLQQRGHSASKVDTWMAKHDDTIYDFFYNGLT